MSDEDVYVHVITNPELGWDCVVGVYVNLDEAAVDLGFENRKALEDDEQYVIHKQRLLGWLR